MRINPAEIGVRAIIVLCDLSAAGSGGGKGSAAAAAAQRMAGSEGMIVRSYQAPAPLRLRELELHGVSVGVGLVEADLHLGGGGLCDASFKPAFCLDVFGGVPVVGAESVS